MTSMLWLRALPAQYETPLSNASRNAVLNHQLRGVSAFCTDVGLDYMGLRDCDPAAVSALALLLGVSPRAFDSGIIRRQGHDYTIRGERLLKHSLRRDRVHVCPTCLADDVTHSSLPPSAAAYCRSHWQLDAVRCCPEHELELIEISPVVDLRARDFAALVEPHLAVLDRLPLRTISRSETTFQQYLIARLEGNAPPTEFLDELEFHAASRLCEILGVTLWLGESRKLNTLSNREWLKAGELGFSFARYGRDGIRNALSELQRVFAYSRSGKDGPQAVFGRVYKWLAFGCEDAAFNPVRELFRQHIVESMPIGTGEMLFGEAVQRRKLHSVRTASLETGAHPKQLRKVLLALGVLRPEDAENPNAWSLFDADAHSDLLEDVREAMPLRVASDYLGAGRVQGRLLFEGNYIRPFVFKSDEHGLREHLFSKRELDAFLLRLFERAGIAADSDQFVSIPTAAKRTNCSSKEILDLVLSGQIESCRLPGPATFMSLLVDYREVRSMVRGEYEGEVNAEEATRRIRTADGATRALIDAGLLPTRTVINPKNRCPVEVISLAAIEQFRRTYCTSGEISRDTGIGPRRIERIIREHSIQPELPREQYRVSFYRRSQLAGISFK